MKTKTLFKQNQEKHLNNLERLSKGEQLSEADYSYLDTCYVCGKPIRFFDLTSHGFAGNVHKFGCNYFSRTFSWVIALLLLPIVFIEYLCYKIYDVVKK